MDIYSSFFPRIWLNKRLTADYRLTPVVTASYAFYSFITHRLSLSLSLIRIGYGYATLYPRNGPVSVEQPQYIMCLTGPSAGEGVIEYAGAAVD